MTVGQSNQQINTLLQDFLVNPPTKKADVNLPMLAYIQQQQLPNELELFTSILN